MSSRSICRAALVAGAVMGLGGCYYVAPPPPGYGYAPAYYYAGPYYYGPPVIGSVFVNARFR